MDRLEAVVDEVVRAFEARRRLHWTMIEGWLRADPTLAHHRPMIEARLRQFANWQVDRDRLLGRMRDRFQGQAWSADFEAGAAELQGLARDDLARHLSDNGVPEADARKIADAYSIGALLHDR